MFQQWSDKITEWLYQKELIDRSHTDVYRYGIQQLLTLILNIVSFFIIGIIFHVILPTMLFLLFYAILRIYAGGYHAKTPIRCYLFSNVIVILFAIIFQHLPMTHIGCSIFTLICAVFILCFSPVGCKNKPLSEKEKKHYRTRSIIVLLAEIAAQQVSVWIGLEMIMFSATLAIGFVSSMMLLGVLSNKLEKNKISPV